MPSAVKEKLVSELTEELKKSSHVIVTEYQGMKAEEFNDLRSKLYALGAKYKVVKGWAEDEIVKHLKLQKDNALVILGAYRRGTVSRWFRESMADVLMKETKVPLFIAHNK